MIAWRRRCEMNKHIGLSVSIFELVFLVAVIIAALLVCKVANTEDKPSLAGTTDITYDTATVGAVVVIGGELRGRGGNASQKWLDIAPTGSKGVKGARVYYTGNLLKRGAQILATGKVDAKGRMALMRLTIVLDSPR
jgi:hypothetical protein